MMTHTRTVPRRPLLSAVIVAEILGVRVERIYELVADDLLPAVRIGKTLRIDPDELDAWIRAGGTAQHDTPIEEDTAR